MCMNVQTRNLVIIGICLGMMLRSVLVRESADSMWPTTYSLRYWSSGSAVCHTVETVIHWVWPVKKAAFTDEFKP